MTLEIFAHTGDRTARAYAGNEDIHLAIGIRPDLRAGCDSVNSRVGRIYELSGDEAVRDLVCQFLCFCNRTFHTLRTFGQHQFRTVGLHQLAALHTHGLRHHQNDPVTSRRGNGCQANTGIAGGRFNNNRAGLQLSSGFRVVDHGFGDPILDRACRIEILKLSKDLCLQIQFFFDMGQL